MSRRSPLPARPVGRFGARLAATTLIAIMALSAVALPALQPPGAPGAATPAFAAPSGSAMMTLINNARHAHGLASLPWASDLAAVAQQRADTMAQTKVLSHTSDLGSKVCCDIWVGENVGYGGSLNQLHAMFMNSSPHAANILKSGADGVGVGVASAGGWLWVAEVFRDRGVSARHNGTTAAGSASSHPRLRSQSGATTTGPGTGTGTGNAVQRSATQPPLSLAALMSLRVAALHARWRQPRDVMAMAMRYPDTLSTISR